MFAGKCYHVLVIAPRILCLVARCSRPGALQHARDGERQGHGRNPVQNMADHGGFTVTRANRPSLAHYPPGATFGPRTMRDLEFVWVLTRVGDLHDRHTRHRAAASWSSTPGTLLLVPTWE